jgi:putative membrane protein
MSHLYFAAKALHLIGMASWMAGLFYLVRIMVNHAEAFGKEEPARGVLIRQFAVMEWKAYRIIAVPAMVITWSFGTLMLVMQPVWLEQAWLWVKLALVGLLTVYTFYCRTHIRRLEAGASRFTHVHYRALNEFPTLILVGAVFLAVYRTGINFAYLFLGIALFAALIVSAVRRAGRR